MGSSAISARGRLNRREQDRAISDGHHVAIVLQFAPPDDTSRNHDVLPSALANERKLNWAQVVVTRLQGVKVALVDLIEKTGTAPAL